MNDLSLPKGWEWKKLGEVVLFKGGSQPPKNEFSDIPKPNFVRLIQIRDYKSNNYITYVNADSVKKFCEENDVMIGRYGPPVFQILRGLKGAYNVALIKAIPNEALLLKDYLFWFLQNSQIQDHIISLSQRSAGQSGVDKNALEKFKILIPPLPEQRRIVAKIDAAFTQLDEAIQLQKQNLAR
ncbi:MAG: restriction endonuclease subunit S, partial [Bacteroidota bacterium]